MNTDFLEEFLDTEGFLLGHINERQKEYLTAKGFPQQLNEAWYYALQSIGGTGALPDMFFQAMRGQIDLANIGGTNYFKTSTNDFFLTSAGDKIVV